MIHVYILQLIIFLRRNVYIKCIISFCFKIPISGYSQFIFVCYLKNSTVFPVIGHRTYSMAISVLAGPYIQ